MRLLERIYDLAIIGGGVNGCGIARDAAGRGNSVFLCEMNDLASGTSSWSTKLVHGGLRYLEYYESRLVREALIERVRATLTDVIASAEQANCEIVIENIEDKNPQDRVGLARALGSSKVRVSLDTGHANYAHHSTGAPPVDYYVDAAGDMLTHVHLQDTDGYADRHWAPGEGNIRWVAVFRALAKLNSNPRLILELRNHDQVRAGAAHLASLGLAE